MNLKEFLQLIDYGEIINLWHSSEKCYLQMEEYKEDIEEEYFNYEVVGINTNYDEYGNALLEINIVNT